MKKEAALCVAGVIFATGAAAQMYKCPDQFGRTIIQQMPCEGGAKMDSRPGDWSDRELRYKIEERKKKEREKQIKEAEEKRKLEEVKRQEEREKKWEEERQKKEKDEQWRKESERKFYENCEKIGITASTPLRIGMTKEQVSCVRGYRKPTKVNTTRTAAGVREQAIYEPDWGATKYLYFDNGILTVIQD